MEPLLEIILKYIVPALAASAGLFGGTWKAADVIVNALSKRAEAVADQRRLDIDLMKMNYETAINILKSQGETIRELEAKIERYEITKEELKACIEKLNERIDAQKKSQGEIDLSYAAVIEELRQEIEQLRIENMELKTELKQTQNNYSVAMARIADLEKRDTGPLRE